MNDKKDRPPVLAHNLYEVIMNTEDSVLAAIIIDLLTPDDVADAIVKKFNHQMMERWHKRTYTAELDDANQSPRKVPT